MSVDGYLEIFTTIFGWHFYNVIWTVFSSAGITYLPFLLILVETWRDAYIDEYGAGATWAVRKMEVEIYCALTVVMLAGMPTNLTGLDKVSLAYQPSPTTFDPTPKVATGASPESTFGAAFAGAPGVAKVPVWWYSMMALSGGLTNAIKAGAGINLRDLRQYEQQARLATIQNSQVRWEVQRFYSECFVPVRTRFFDNTRSAAAAAAISTWGEEDPDWMGSHAYLEDPALYPSHYSDTQVPGWAFDPARDRDVAGQRIVPEWGRPTCKQWWDDPNLGVRAKLINEAKATSGVWDTMTTLFASLPIEAVRDKAARIVLEKTPLSYMDTQPTDTSFFRTPRLNDAWQVPRDLSAAAGVIKQFWNTYVAMSIVRPALPMVQALVLMAIYMFVGLALIISRYALSTMFTGAIAIFTVKFWSVMWFITDWLDDHLILSMYPNANSLMEFMGSVMSGEGVKRLVLNLLILSLYLGLPLIWSAMMAWVGVNVGRSVHDAQRSAILPLEQAAGSGTSTLTGSTRFLRGIGGRSSRRGK